MITPEDIIEQTKKELLDKRLDSELGERLRAIYGSYLYNFMTPAMYDGLRSAIAWDNDDPPFSPEGLRRIKHVTSFPHVADREIQSVVSALICAEAAATGDTL